MCVICQRVTQDSHIGGNTIYQFHESARHNGDNTSAQTGWLGWLLKDCHNRDNNQSLNRSADIA